MEVRCRCSQCKWVDNHAAESAAYELRSNRQLGPMCGSGSAEIEDSISDFD
jgi:hypothetical protein